MTTQLPDDPQRADRRRRTLMQQGLAVNQKLTQLLAGQNATLATLPLPGEGKPGESKIERLKRFLAQISRAQQRLNAGDFGSCLQCGARLPDPVLDEAPWVELCQPCEMAELQRSRGL